MHTNVIVNQASIDCAEMFSRMSRTITAMVQWMIPGEHQTPVNLFWITAYDPIKNVRSFFGFDQFDIKMRGHWPQSM